MSQVIDCLVCFHKQDSGRQILRVHTKNISPGHTQEISDLFISHAAVFIIHAAGHGAFPLPQLPFDHVAKHSPVSDTKNPGLADLTLCPPSVTEYVRQ